MCCSRSSDMFMYKFETQVRTQRQQSAHLDAGSSSAETCSRTSKLLTDVTSVELSVTSTVSAGKQTNKRASGSINVPYEFFI